MPVYFIQAENGLIKIGCSRNTSSLPTRLHEIVNMSPVPVSVLGIIPEEHSDLRYHRFFSHLRHHAEWFTPGQDLLDFIKANTIPYQRRKGIDICKGVRPNGELCRFKVNGGGEYCNHHDPALKHERMSRVYHSRK